MSNDNVGMVKVEFGIRWVPTMEKIIYFMRCGRISDTDASMNIDDLHVERHLVGDA